MKNDRFWDTPKEWDKHLDVVFHPLVKVQSDGLFGVEALARWADKEGGIVGPEAAFDAGADPDSTSLEIMELAIKQRASVEGSFLVSVNLSGRLFCDPKVQAKAKELLEKYDLPAACLMVELLEDEPLEGLDLRAAFDAWEAMGAWTAIDDFGAWKGFNTAQVVREAGPDVLKLDRKALGGTNPRYRVLMALGIAREVQAHLLVEGVESAEDVRLLESLGAHAGQGYHYSKPVSDLEGLSRKFPSRRTRTRKGNGRGPLTP